MAIDRSRARRLGFAVAGVVVFVIGFGSAATRPSSNPQLSASGVGSNPSGSVQAPTPAPSIGELTTEPIRQVPDGGGRDVAAPSEIHAGSVNRSTMAMTATYDAVVDLAVRDGGMRVSATIIARNDDPEPIDRIELNTTAAPLAGMKLAKVRVDGNEVVASVDDQTITVPLGGVLRSGGRVRVELAYTATVRTVLERSRWLMARSAGIVELYRWLPWVSRATPFEHANGDPFVTPTSPRVRVRLRTNHPVTVGASGDQVAGADQPSQDMTFVAENVRDFTLILSEGYRVTEWDLDGVRMRALTKPGGLPVSTIRELADSAVRTYAANLGPYPWPTLTMAESVSGVGVESPALVWLPTQRINDLPYLVTHEIAHEWFYSLVGNDQVSDAFADEAIGDFMARDLIGTLRAPRCDFEDADKSIYDYASGPCYYESVYIRGSQLYDSIRDDIGDTAFWAALRGYVEAHRFGFGSTRELLDALRAASPVDLRPRIEALLPSIY